MTARTLPDPVKVSALLAAVIEWKRGQSAPAPVVMRSAIAAPAPTNVTTLDERLAMACGVDGGAREVDFTSNSVARMP